ncbi:flagellar biosynthesis protein FlgB [Methylobacterium sp. Leaf469]|uniref:flagellar basal body rod protein FlgB n=1 Tax=unclassified Methylobacterium TaxID=2615210 RepID=UPI0006F600F6|nr:MULTISPECIES: flagellar basal body rod protein FlgB [unclassified Methylobacterium]KQO69099.1 flagellar biosynthesis protein FlgB [Methylobacterium sp. Leaf87]KQP31434.1 flagellar biosynthesis protein FlgB [Methylobacterium sp. Leaf100]KQT98790.1 flagellar biosynthesis protein FlgB [Methylobacterium sp. Leaf469]USU32822.1 flagellar basal body rod protein FlgB [Methylobacterium sp. OTU13CASTA1]
MSVTDLPTLGMLRTRMQWHQTRQKILAENVANADMPGFKPRDLANPDLGRGGGGGTLAMTQPVGASGGSLAVTSPAHIALAGMGEGPGADPRRVRGFEIRPSGNGVNLEEEMIKAADNQGSYGLASSMYQKSLETLKIAIGKR